MAILVVESLDPQWKPPKAAFRRNDHRKDEHHAERKHNYYNKKYPTRRGIRRRRREFRLGRNPAKLNPDVPPAFLRRVG